MKGSTDEARRGLEWTKFKQERRDRVLPIIRALFTGQAGHK